MLFRHALGFDRIVQVDGNRRGPQDPIARPQMVDGTYQAHRHNRHAELLRQAESSFFKLRDAAISCPLRLGKNDQAGASVDRFLRHPPKPFQIFGAAHVRDGHIAEALHQPAINRDLEMRFQFPAAHHLWNRAVQHERVKDIDVVDHENRSFLCVEPCRHLRDDFRAGEKCDPAAKPSLQPVMFSRIEYHGQGNQYGHDNQEMQPTHSPQKDAAQHLPSSLHTYTSIAPGKISSRWQFTVTISPSIIRSTGASSANSTALTARVSASGCAMCVPSYNRGSIFSSPNLPIGPQRTYSMKPSDGSAFGAIIIVPPVYLLLLKDKKRHRRSSHSRSASERILKPRRFN